MNTIYLLTKKITGPAGHGEPGTPYLTIATDGKWFDLGNPINAFMSEEDASNFKETNSDYSNYEITEIKLHK